MNSFIVEVAENAVGVCVLSVSFLFARHTISYMNAGVILCVHGDASAASQLILYAPATFTAAEIHFEQNTNKCCCRAHRMHVRLV